MSSHIPGLKQPNSYFARKINLRAYRPGFVADPRKLLNRSDINTETETEEHKVIDLSLGKSTKKVAV